LYFQSNIEGEILNELHNSDDENIIGIVLNAGAFTHYSIAIRDAIASISTPVVEVHISNIFAREEFRQKSVISAVCKGVISGFGLLSYTLAIRYLCETF
jgi:3-dehydroquinate dehydratase-2